MKNLILLFLLTSSIVLFGQDRVDIESVAFESESGVLKKVTGWSYEEISGKWESHKGYFKYGHGYNGTIGYKSGYSSHSQNMKSMQFKKLCLNSVNYFVLIYTTTNSGYLYPNIKEEPYSFKSYEAFAFSEKDYNKFINIDTNVVTIKTRYYAGSRNEKKLAYLIRSKLSDPENVEAKFTFKKVTGKDLVRFTLPGGYPPSSLDKGYFEITFEDFLKLKI